VIKWTWNRIFCISIQVYALRIISAYILEHGSHEYTEVRPLMMFPCCRYTELISGSTYAHNARCVVESKDTILWTPTLAARRKYTVRVCGIYGGQNCSGSDFLRVLRFPQPVKVSWSVFVLDSTSCGGNRSCGQMLLCTKLK
jgi:hypothetical protein